MYFQLDYLMPTHVRVYTHMHACMHIRTYADTHTCAPVHTHTRTCTHTRTHTHTDYQDIFRAAIVIVKFVLSPSTNVSMTSWLSTSWLALQQT